MVSEIIIADEKSLEEKNAGWIKLLEAKKIREKKRKLLPSLKIIN